MLLLDGDQRRPSPPPSADISDSNLETELTALLNAKATKVVPANTGGPSSESMRKVIEFARSNVRYLPGEEPDAWLAYEVEPGATNVGDGKKWWNDRTKALMGRLQTESASSAEQLAIQTQALSQLPDEHDDLKEIDRILEEFLSRPTSE